MTRNEYIGLIAKLYRVANSSDGDDPNKPAWLKGDECAVHCQAFDAILRHMDFAGHIDEFVDECATKECGYYTHYLAYGPADLTHDGYHAAVAKCLAAQQKLMDWMDANPTKDPQRTPLCRIAEHWEKQVRA